MKKVIINQALYHLSFDDHDDKYWQARHPQPMDLYHTPHVHNPIPFIPLFVSIEDNLRAIHSKIKDSFGIRPDGKLSLFVYQFVDTGIDEIALPKTLTKDRLSPIAHVVNMHGALAPVYMKRTGLVIIDSTSFTEREYYYHYGKRTTPHFDGWVPKQVVGIDTLLY